MIYLYGAGGHAKVVTEILNLCGHKCAGVFDQNESARVWSIPWYAFPGPFDTSRDQLHISVGNNIHRKNIAALCTGMEFHNALHPSATLSASSVLGSGIAVMAGVIVNADTRVGNHVILNTACSIDHDCHIQDFVHIGPGSILCGNVKVEEGTLIGAGSVIIPGIRIGRNCVIGAGSVIIKDIESNTRWAGNPARNLAAPKT